MSQKLSLFVNSKLYLIKKSYLERLKNVERQSTWKVDSKRVRILNLQTLHYFNKF